MELCCYGAARLLPALRETAAGIPFAWIASTISLIGSVEKYSSGPFSMIFTSLRVTPSLSARRASSKLIAEHNPDVVISLGQAEGRTQITPEKVAINLDDARLADNEGVMRYLRPSQPKPSR